MPGAFVFLRIVICWSCNLLSLMWSLASVQKLQRSAAMEEYQEELLEQRVLEEDVLEQADDAFEL